ncbi:MAG: ADP-ribosylation factor-like protein [Promethearchaeia archaeon]
MSKQFELKLILCGAALSGKTTFLFEDSPLQDNTFEHIGLAFKRNEVLLKKKNREVTDSYKFTIWDLKATERLKFMYDTFCKGACGAIICFDVNDHNSFKQVEDWVQIIRESVGNVPLILLGTKNDLEKVVTEEEIFDLLEEHNFRDIFFTSIKDPHLKVVKKEIYRVLIQTLHPKLNFDEIELILPEQDDKFKEFAETFQNCIICGKRNHKDYLKKFYFSKDPETKILKEKILEIMERKSQYQNIIEIGIPCCKCFKKFFSD